MVDRFWLLDSSLLTFNFLPPTERRFSVGAACRKHRLGYRTTVIALANSLPWIHAYSERVELLLEQRLAADC
ncbi:hypothetical protein [Aerosakkonema funiforme]|uniref:hypothetical protein n=1 Tax=Aerosakkonema funiforme TaxID=1246630 RepID=UPI0035BC701B